LPRVLIVDDEVPIRLLCRVNLEADGMEVVEAADGLSGLARAQAERPDIVLLGVMMPELDGWGLAQQLQDDPSTRDIPFVFLTARSRYRDHLRGFELGAADYITKPFNALQLASRLRTVLARTREERDAARREMVSEMKKWIRHEDTTRMRLRDLLEQRSAEIFGCGVTKVWDIGDMQMLRIWLDDGSEWAITVKPTSPPQR
jgi:DNA-binding response OmpR family regulator